MQFAQSQSYPTVRIGGLFVAVVGLAIAASAFFGGKHLMSPVLFFGGFGIAIGGVLLNGTLRARLAFGELSAKQRIVLRAALALEAVLILGVSLIVGGADERLYWLLVLLAVAIHFLPLVVVHGPWMGVLGALCTVNAIVGLLVPSAPFLVLAATDGALKIVLGGLMFMQRPLPAASGAHV